MIKLFLNLFPRPFLIRVSYLMRPLIVFFFKGKNFIDPIDGNSYRRFLPYGYGKSRKNALSPGTLSLERHRLMYLFLKNETTFFTDNLKVLHIAPEQCFLDRFKKLTNLEYISADLYSPIVDVKADILNLPFQNEEFDVVICNHVLEHIQDDYIAMNELFRVMKKGGFGIFQVPMKNSLDKTYEDKNITLKEDRKKHFGQYDHVRWYGMDYFKRLENAGFEVFPIKYYEKLGKENVKKYGLSSTEILPFVKKN